MRKLSEVNTTDILGAIRLGCRTMCSVFNADDNDVPFCDAVVRPEARLSCAPDASDAHMPGRFLNALLNAEDAAGVHVDEDCVEKNARVAFFSYGGPVAFPLNRAESGGPVVNFSAHHFREGFHALTALVRHRDSAKARCLAEASIASIVEYWEPVRGWDYGRLEREHGLSIHKADTFIVGLARAIGPLVKYYRASRYAPALDLAIVLKEKAIQEFFVEDGTHDVARFGHHSHSTTCVMSSLAQLADLTRDSALMNRVKAFYDRGLWDIRDELGWSIESTRPGQNPDFGEANNTGDILETALILGRWGYTECYHDAERILRGHLLPSQLRDVSFIAEPPNPEGVDGKRDVANRLIGAFGFPAPYGHEPLAIEAVPFNLDIVGGAVGSLCEAYREIARSDEVGHHVNLLFDHETPAIKVLSPYTHPCLGVIVKKPGPLFVRIPPWADVRDMQVEGAQGPARFTNGYLFFPRPPVNRTISLEFPLPVQEITLKHRTRQIRARLRGDEVVAMENFGADLTFFDSLG